MAIDSSKPDILAVDWLKLAVEQSQQLHPYIPGKPVAQMLRELGLNDVEVAQRIATTIKLASNENPYGVPPKAMAAMQQSIDTMHRYPDGDCFELKQLLAKKHKVLPEQLLVGNGSNEVLELVIRCFASAGDNVVYSQHAFIVYALATLATGAKGIAVPEADGFTHDLTAMAAAVNQHTKIICIANPNNPTGSLLSSSSLQLFLDTLPRALIVILDEAYYEYVMDTVGDTVHGLKHPGLIITRTFSKAYGLAGCRVGYAVADKDILAIVNRFREPFNVSTLAQAAAIGALADEGWVMAKVDACKKERERLEECLISLACLAVKSAGNFVLLQHKESLILVKALELKGVIVRPLAAYGMPDILRVSVGSAEENNQFINVLTEVLGA